MYFGKLEKVSCHFNKSIKTERQCKASSCCTLKFINKNRFSFLALIFSKENNVLRQKIIVFKGGTTQQQ